MKNQKIPNLALVQTWGRFADMRGDEHIHSATDNQPPAVSEFVTSKEGSNTLQGGGGGHGGGSP